MKNVELVFLMKLVEQSEANNLNWDVENIGGHNREFSCSFKYSEIFTVTLITPTVASPRAQLLVTSHLPSGEDAMLLITADTKTLAHKEEVDLLVRLKNSAINYVNVIKEQRRAERIKNGIDYLELKGKSTEIDYTTGEHWQFDTDPKPKTIETLTPKAFSSADFTGLRESVIGQTTSTLAKDNPLFFQWEGDDLEEYVQVEHNLSPLVLELEVMDRPIMIFSRWSQEGLKILEFTALSACIEGNLEDTVIALKLLNAKHEDEVTKLGNWRLPTKDELLELRDVVRDSHAFDDSACIDMFSRTSDRSYSATEVRPTIFLRSYPLHRD